MIPLLPVEILQRICANKSAFIEAQIIIHAPTGHLYAGTLVDAVYHNKVSSLLLKSSHPAKMQRVALSLVEGLSIENPTQQQIAIMNGEEFDPLAGQPATGNLALKRELKSAEEKLSKILSENLQVILAKYEEDPPNPTVNATLVSALKLLVTTVEQHFAHEVAKAELNKKVQIITLYTSKVSKVTISSGNMEIHCPWQQPSERWTEVQLKKAINDAF